MPSPAPEPLAPRPLSIWLVNPLEDIPGEAVTPHRTWSLARILATRGHDVTWWSATWSHRRKAIRSSPLGIRDDEGFSVRLVAVRPYERDASLARIGSHRDFGRTFERLASESIASGQLERPDMILASLPPLEGPEAAARLARRLDCTFVLDVTDVCPESLERVLPGPAFLKRLIAPFVTGGMLRRRQSLVECADAVSAATRTYADTVAGGAMSVPRHVCTVGVYPQEFPAARRLINHVPLPDGTSLEPSKPPTLECVYAGSLESSQDLDTLTATTRQLSATGVSAVIHIVGTGAAEATMRRAAAAGGGACRMEVHGLPPRDAYVSLLAGCDVGLVCTKPESHVVVPDEACDYAAAGLAIVNSLPGELQALIDDHGAGIPYTASDAASLTQAITGLAADRTLLAACRQGARRLAAAEFDRERTYARFADWLETVSESASTP